jgi:hypothetical protein
MGKLTKPQTMELTREVTKAECPWLDADMPKGAKVKLYTRYTYGCVSGKGVACCFDDAGPFFEIPRDALQGDSHGRSIR